MNAERPAGEPVLPQPFSWWDEHVAINLPGARALFTTRRGGVSRGPYWSLNLGPRSEDNPGAVKENLERIQRRLGVSLVPGRQVHGRRVAHAEQTARQFAGGSTAEPAEGGLDGAGDGMAGEADGQVSGTRGLAPMVLAADCLPVAVGGGGAVAMLHAGWRGLAAGVLSEGAARVQERAEGLPQERADGLRQKRAESRELVAAIGPGAGVCCYEVSDEVREQFDAYGTEVQRGRNLDLKLVARRQLEAAGINTVHDVGLCTICGGESLFFSHRRDHGLTGRQAGIAWLT